MIFTICTLLCAVSIESKYSICSASSLSSKKSRSGLPASSSGAVLVVVGNAVVVVVEVVVVVVVVVEVVPSVVTVLVVVSASVNCSLSMLLTVLATVEVELASIGDLAEFIQFNSSEFIKKAAFARSNEYSDFSLSRSDRARGGDIGQLRLITNSER